MNKIEDLLCEPADDSNNSQFQNYVKLAFKLKETAFSIYSEKHPVSSAELLTVYRIRALHSDFISIDSFLYFLDTWKSSEHIYMLSITNGSSLFIILLDEEKRYLSHLEKTMIVLEKPEAFI